MSFRPKRRLTETTPAKPCEFEWLQNDSGDCTPLTDWASFVSSIFVLTTMAIAFIHIRNHLKLSRQKMLTRYTIRILLMPPIYGSECWLALRFPKHAVPYRLLREGYEAFVIFSFMQFLLAYLGGAVPLARRLHIKRKTGQCKDQHHVFPFNFLEPWRSGAQFVRMTLVGTLQYIPASLLVMLISLSAWQLDWYHDGSWKFSDAYMYCAIITNCSQVWAMYCLVLFYHALHDELKPIRPFGKFLSVKLVVFFTYWQSLAIGIMQTVEGEGGVLDEMQDAIKGEGDAVSNFDDEFDPPGFTQHEANFGISSSSGSLTSNQYTSSSNQGSLSNESSEQFATSLQNFIICVEMFFFAVGHVFAFPAEEFAGRTYRAQGHHDEEEVYVSESDSYRLRGGSSELSDEFESESEEPKQSHPIIMHGNSSNSSSSSSGSSSGSSSSGSSSSGSSSGDGGSDYPDQGIELRNINDVTSSHGSSVRVHSEPDSSYHNRTSPTTEGVGGGGDGGGGGGVCEVSDQSTYLRRVVSDEVLSEKRISDISSDIRGVEEEGVEECKRGSDMSELEVEKDTGTDDSGSSGGDRQRFRRRLMLGKVNAIKSRVMADFGKGVDQVRESGSLVGDSLTALPRGLAATIYDGSMNVVRSSANLPASVVSAARDGGNKIDEARGAVEVVAAVGGASVKVAKSIGTGVADIAKNVGQLPVRTVGSAVGGTVNVGRVAATQVLRRLPMLPPLHKERFRDGINFTDIVNAIRTVTYLEVEEERSHLLDFVEDQESAWNEEIGAEEYSSNDEFQSLTPTNSHVHSKRQGTSTATTKKKTTTIPKNHSIHGSTKSA